jgi:hypothetical protein
MYACGLRIGEATTLEIGSVDRANQVLRIIGKGDKERLVLLPQPALDELGTLWRTHRNPRWLFPNRRRDGPLNQRVLSHTFAAAADAAGIRHGVTPLTNARIVGLDDETVTIQYKERKTGCARTCRLSGHEFMRRFLQHVLPRGFHKVRYFGLWHPSQRQNAARVRQMLRLQAQPKLDPLPDLVVPSTEPRAEAVPPIEPLICPHCQGRLIFIRTLSPRQAMAP